jgi:ABC-type uncharacterized transport system substrate-binding protein
MKRRDFITLLGGAAAAWPLAASAQQPAMPVVGVLGSGSAHFKDAFVRGLSEAGYVEGQNVRVEYRWAAGAYDRLSAMADELVNLRVNVIATFGSAAKAASTKVSPPIPVVFVLGSDPVAEGLFASPALVNELGGAKGLALLHELVPNTATVGFLENPNNPTFELTTRAVLAAGPVIGLRVQVLKAGTDREIDAAFVSLVQARTGALLVGNDSFFNSLTEQLVALAARHAIPTMYPTREFVVAGGLISYGTSLMENYRQVGLYTGRILKGEMPADLPVIQATTIELIINLKTAKTLGLEVSAKLLALADEVIE